MRKYSKKLIRDNIPELIEQTGKLFHCQTFPVEEYLPALKEKLLEEAKETAIALENNNNEDIVNEIADLYEVLDAILLLRGIKKSQAISKQREKRKVNGAFQKRLQLVWVEDN